MGFRTGAYAKVWKVEPASETRTKLQISISRKDKRTGEYVTDFSGFVNVIGTTGANKAATLSVGDRIKLGDCDVTTNYVKDKNITYTNYALFSFEDAESQPSESGASHNNSPDNSVDSGEVNSEDTDDSEEKLPF